MEDKKTAKLFVGNLTYKVLLLSDSFRSLRRT